MIFAALTDIGLVRENNQDSYFASDIKEFPLFLIGDGMGGHKAGEVASKMAVDIIKEVFLKNRDILTSEQGIISIIEMSIKEANLMVYNRSLDDIKLSGMGTTITLAYIFQNNIYIGHVGDSRAYFIDKGIINQITEDHSLVNELIKNGSISLEESKNHPQKNLITRAVGTSSEILLDTFIKEYKKGDILVLCSDGLSGMVKNEEILNTFNKNDDVKIACKELVSFAKENGGLDNITIIGIKFK